MTGRETGRDGEDATLDVFVAALRARFGERAVAVAETQCEAADGEARTTWREILNRLRRD